MKRAVCIIGSMDVGGAQAILMKFYRELDKSKYQLDFCVFSDEPGFYDDEIRELGGNIVYAIGKRENGLVASFRRFMDIAREGGYCAAIEGSQYSLSVFNLFAMRAGGVPRTVLRSINVRLGFNSRTKAVLHRVFRPFVRLAATSYVAPSTEAGLYMFGESGVRSNKFSILHNAVDLQEFAYREDSRKKIRKELGIPESAFVIGHVGRFHWQKNHAFLLDVFAEVSKKRDDAVLLLLGTGDLVEDVRRKAEVLGLSGQVIFAGVRRDVALCYSAMDKLVFPSFYEGLPNVVIEAQANGLPCIISSAITQETIINRNVMALPLSAGTRSWSDAVTLFSGKRIEDGASELRAAGYDIKKEISNFVKLVFED